MRYSERIAFVFAGVCLLVAAFLALFVRTQTPAHKGSGANASSGTVAREIMSVESGGFNGRRWYLADVRTHSVHVLDSTGQYLTSIGRRGNGPGEFVGPVLIAVSGALVYVAELGRTDVSVFDTSGVFRQHLKAPGSCRGGHPLSMAALADSVYVLRHCLELPAHVRYQLERSTNGARFEPWLWADTVPIQPGGALPINIRLLAIAAGQLVVGNGDTGCLRSFQLPEGRALGTKCLYGIRRVPAPPPAQSPARRRASFGDSLPRFAGLVLRADLLVAQAVHSKDSATWLEFDWNAPEQSRGRTLGRSVASPSFLSRDTQLIAHDDADGVRIEVIRVRQ